MQRACAVALISGGTTIIENAGNSNDEEAAKDIIAKLGATVDSKRNEIIVTSPAHIFTSPDKNKNVNGFMRGKWVVFKNVCALGCPV